MTGYPVGYSTGYPESGGYMTGYPVGYQTGYPVGAGYPVLIRSQWRDQILIRS